LHVHRGAVEAPKAAEILSSFAATLPMKVVKGDIPHIRSTVVRLTW